MTYIVLVDCGYSEWFDTRDMRPYGPFATMDEAERWAARQSESVVGRDGNMVTGHVLEMVAVPELVTV